MKRFLLTLILVLALLLTFTTPVFADDGSMPDQGKAGLQKAYDNIRWCMAGGLGVWNGQGLWNGLGWWNGQGLHRAYGSGHAGVQVKRAITQGCPPGQTVP